MLHRWDFLQLCGQLSSVTYQNLEFYAYSVTDIGFLRNEEQYTKCEKVRQFGNHKGKHQGFFFWWNSLEWSSGHRFSLI
jgi:hypothetical protein